MITQNSLITMVQRVIVSQIYSVNSTPDLYLFFYFGLQELRSNIHTCWSKSPIAMLSLKVNGGRKFGSSDSLIIATITSPLSDASSCRVNRLHFAPNRWDFQWNWLLLKIYCLVKLL